MVIGLINYRFLDANAKTLLLLVAFASVPHIATIINRDLPVIYYNSYILTDSLLCPLVFLKSSNISKIKRWLVLVLIINSCIVLAGLVLGGISKRFYYELVVVNSIFQMLLVTLYFYELNYRNEYIVLKKERMFWFCIGLLFYAPCTFFVFLFYNKINHYYAKSDLNYLWQIHDFFNTLMYFLFGIGFMLKKKALLSHD
jgi:hypothetical protein